MSTPITPRSLKDPPQPPVLAKELTRWTRFLGDIAAGTPIEDAMLKHFMTRADIEACVLHSDEERNRFAEARSAAKKRSWSVLAIEDVFAKVSSGKFTLGEAIDAVVPGGNHAAFTDMCTSDPALYEHYMRALKSRAVLVGEDLMAISDDKTNDTLEGPKGTIPNNAAVARDKLRIETRQKLMGHWFPKLFGEKQQNTQVNVQVNYAERLEEARARANSRTATPKITNEIVEAAFKELVESKPETDKPEWDDVHDEPVSTLWRENE